ncbi:MAG TPA: ATP-grasp domain-containing protein [Sphingomonas sp.]|jgi:carbamoyl-phosphate synthase large subunit|nr:ATP-grasp domain-containing protein [Sphingomonas sp.]
MSELPHADATVIGMSKSRVQRQKSQRRLRMLISSAGRRVSLLRCFRTEAESLGIDLTVLATDLKPEWSAACVEADQALAVPVAGSDAFIPYMLKVCEREQIGLIIPTIDTELLAFSHAREDFAAIGTAVAVSDASVVEMARDKFATAAFLKSAGLPTPRTETIEQMLVFDQEWNWPVLAKPRGGSSSRGIHRVADSDELARFVADEPYIIQEIMRGREFTVNLYFDRGGTLHAVVPHERLRVRAGEVEKGATSRDPTMCSLGWQLGSKLEGAAGVLCFQAFLSDSGESSIFEINARFGGGYPLVHWAGAPFARWLLEEALGLESSAGDHWRPDALMLRFDDAVFL